MQFLIFHLGRDRYGLHTQRVRRIVPLLDLKKLPQTPAYVAGLMNFHGETVPVIDLCMLAGGTPGQPYFDTRIVLVDYFSASGSRHLLGLIAERVAGVEKIASDAFDDAGVANSDARYLGQVGSRDGAILQLIEVDHLLPDTVRAILFPQAAAEAAC